MGCTFCNLIRFSEDHWNKIINGEKRKHRMTKQEAWELKKEIAYDIATMHPEMVTLINGYVNLTKGGTDYSEETETEGCKI
jgi:hypothetical protein